MYIGGIPDSSPRSDRRDPDDDRTRLRRRLSLGKDGVTGDLGEDAEDRWPDILDSRREFVDVLGLGSLLIDSRPEWGEPLRADAGEPERTQELRPLCDKARPGGDETEPSFRDIFNEETMLERLVVSDRFESPRDRADARVDWVETED